MSKGKSKMVVDVHKGHFSRGELVEVKGVPWKGVIGKYIKKAGWFHIVEVGDLVSGGTPRRIKVRGIRKVDA